MFEEKEKNVYDDGNIPDVDMPQNSMKDATEQKPTIVEPLPESFRPRKDGPGGE